MTVDPTGLMDAALCDRRPNTSPESDEALESVGCETRAISSRSARFGAKTDYGTVPAGCGARDRISSATDHAWNGHPVAAWGASPSVVSEIEPSPYSDRCSSSPSRSPDVSPPA